MKSKLIIAAVVSTLMLCSCGETKVDLQESVTVSQTESTTVSETTETTETESVSEPSETSETAEKVSFEDIPDILELPNERKMLSAIIPENMEFTINLKDITPETDLFALTNMEKHSLGEAFTIDLDGDGVEEEISISEEKFGENWRFLCIEINGTVYEIDYDLGYANTPNEVFTCDIDSSDNYIEFACNRSTLTNDFKTSFYRYENGELRRIFDIGYDTPDGNGEVGNFMDEMNASVTGKPIVTDGSGVITAARRLDAQTWLAYSHYVYDSESGEISLVCEPVYPYYYENIDNFDMAMELTSEYYIPDVVPERPLPKTSDEIKLYKEPNLSSETVTLAPQRVYFTAEYPYPVENPAAYDDGLCEWIYLVAEDGTTGWIRSYIYRYIDEEESNEMLFDVFGKGLVYYD